MARNDDWLDSDPWLSDAEWLELERCSLEWLESGEPEPPPRQLAKLEPLVQRLLEFTLAAGHKRGKYVPPPGGMYRLLPDGIKRVYEDEHRWQEYLTRDCDRMLRPLSGAAARLLIAIRTCKKATTISFRQAVRFHLADALIRAAQDGAKNLRQRDKQHASHDGKQSTTAEQTQEANGEDDRDARGYAVGAEAPRRASAEEDDDAPQSPAIDLASVKRLEYTWAELLGDDERKPCVLAAIEELDQESRARTDMAPPALLVLDDLRCRKISRFALSVALSLKLFVGHHSQTRQAVTLREACSALKRQAEAISQARSIPIAAAFDTMNQPVLWDVLRDLGVQVEAPNTMTVRLKRTRRRLLERVLELVTEARKGHAGTPPVTTTTDRPNKGGDQA